MIPWPFTVHQHGPAKFPVDHLKGWWVEPLDWVVKNAPSLAFCFFARQRTRSTNQSKSKHLWSKKHSRHPVESMSLQLKRKTLVMPFFFVEQEKVPPQRHTLVLPYLFFDQKGGDVFIAWCEQKPWTFGWPCLLSLLRHCTMKKSFFSRGPWSDTLIFSSQALVIFNRRVCVRSRCFLCTRRVFMDRVDRTRRPWTACVPWVHPKSKKGHAIEVGLESEWADGVHRSIKALLDDGRKQVFGSLCTA